MADRHESSSSGAQPRDLHVSLLGSFDLAVGSDPVPLPVGSKRLLAFLALRGRAVMRTAVAGTLWPDVAEPHALASLRSALSRLGVVARWAVHADGDEMSLTPAVRVDLADARALAHRLLALAPLQSGDLSAGAIAALSGDLLPDWYEDWAVLEAEEWRQLRLHALEALGNRLLLERRFGEAAGAALAATRTEPLRETAHALLIRVHLAEENQDEALAAFDRYAVLLRAELGLKPTPLLRALVRDLLPE
jgi:DNA-binding SARP family transcriptional activator